VNESEFTRLVLAELRSKKNCKVYKHADRFTGAIPDISVTTRGRTTWLELKAVTKGDSPIAVVSQKQLQLHDMYELAMYGRAVYVIWDDGFLTIWHPEYLVRRIITDKKMAWNREMYIHAEAHNCVGELERLVKSVGKRDPILITPFDLKVLQILVEV
jgi:hypothetical protein